MNVLTLKSPSGKEKNYKYYSSIPKEGDFIVPINFPEDEEHFKASRFRNLSDNKIYQVYRVVNTNQVLVVDDVKESVHLTKSHYKIVQELSEAEYKMLTEQYKLLRNFDNAIKSKSEVN